MNGQALVSLIQSVVNDTLESFGLTDEMHGSVLSTSPIKVRVEDRFDLFAASISLSPLCYENKVKIQGEDVVIWPGLKKGDSVQVLRVAKGKKYYILGKEGGVW